jgi:SAF domain.
MRFSFFKRIKAVLGIILILASIAALFFWEWKGRDIVMMDKVLIAKEDIKAGTAVNGGMLTVEGVPRGNLLEEALRPKDIELIQGKTATQFIAKNGQIILQYFAENELVLNSDESVFVINPAWIAMRSSSIRRGDMVDIYGSGGLGLLGTFRIAYVKDELEREVRDTGSDNGPTGNSSSVAGHNKILDRTDSTSVIDHIEIITTYKEYEDLVDIVEGTEGTTPTALIIVQRGDQIDT